METLVFFGMMFIIIRMLIKNSNPSEGGSQGMNIFDIGNIFLYF